jgi:hypothetical protein
METGEMIYANAGHNAPWVLRAEPGREIKFDDLPDAEAAAGPKVKKVGGKLKIKVGGKKASSEEQADVEAAPKKKLKVRMGGKKSVEDSTTDVSAEEGGAVAVEADEPAPKKKLKVRMGKKEEDGAEGASGETSSENSDAEATPKKKIKVKLGSKSKSGKKPNAWENLNARGMRLGEVDDATFDCRRTRLFKGDMMVWYTDGWVENTSPSMEEFGKRRCQKILEEHKEKEPKEIIEELRIASWEFYEDLPRGDDVTIVIGKVKEDW